MIEINEASNKDFITIENIGKELLPIYYKTFDLFVLLLGNHKIFKISDNDNIIGFVVIQIINEQNRIHIMSIGIKETNQRSGYGTTVIQFLKNRYKQNISLYVQVSNSKAVSFYQKNAFRIEETLDNYYTDLENKEAYYMISNS